ncbi:hypothetical protein COLO4_30267 [Corchorus olitorius]|uniref:Uncharacterized protein n=1 Tax=Corchorus olitorius TaxID=93759 RepID=A0A1R3H9B5_9ROSI|nr:hypothetical protein COLO4_30267 [Corchorus olitorius]
MVVRDPSKPKNVDSIVDQVRQVGAVKGSAPFLIAIMLWCQIVSVIKSILFKNCVGMYWRCPMFGYGAVAAARDVSYSSQIQS